MTSQCQAVVPNAGAVWFVTLTLILLVLGIWDAYRKAPPPIEIKRKKRDWENRV